MDQTTRAGTGIRLLLADDESIVRTGIRMILDAAGGLEVVGEASDGAEAVDLALRLEPDVVLMDLRMPRMDGVAATRTITTSRDETRVLALTTFRDEDLMYDALRAGASGYLLKQAAPSQLVEAILSVNRGAAWIDSDMAPHVIAVLRSRLPPSGDADSLVAVLTARERHILQLVAEGRSNRDISESLVLSEATVKTHVARILMKTGSHDRAAAVALAWRTGFMGH